MGATELPESCRYPLSSIPQQQQHVQQQVQMDESTFVDCGDLEADQPHVPDLMNSNQNGPDLMNADKDQWENDQSDKQEKKVRFEDKQNGKQSIMQKLKKKSSRRARQYNSSSYMPQRVALPSKISIPAHLPIPSIQNSSRKNDKALDDVFAKERAKADGTSVARKAIKSAMKKKRPAKKKNSKKPLPPPKATKQDKPRQKLKVFPRDMKPKDYNKGTRIKGRVDNGKNVSEEVTGHIQGGIITCKESGKPYVIVRSEKNGRFVRVNIGDSVIKLRPNTHGSSYAEIKASLSTYVSTHGKGKAQHPSGRPFARVPRNKQLRLRPAKTKTKRMHRLLKATSQRQGQVPKKKSHQRRNAFVRSHAGFEDDSADDTSFFEDEDSDLGYPDDHPFAKYDD